MKKQKNEYWDEKLLESCKTAMLKNGIEKMTYEQAIERFEDNINTIMFMYSPSEKLFNIPLMNWIEKQTKRGKK